MSDQGSQIISNSTYNLLAILLSKLEGLEAYDEYMSDMDGEGKQLLDKYAAMMSATPSFCVTPLRGLSNRAGYGSFLTPLTPGQTAKRTCCWFFHSAFRSRWLALYSFRAMVKRRASSRRACSLRE